jgi:hypothetical protein
MRTAILAAVAVSLLSAGLAAAQLGDPAGPGQAVPAPPAQCPRTFACQYAERNYLPDGYRFQALRVCGANCTTQYWASSIPDGQSLLAIDPVRGGGIVAVGQAASPQDPHPPVRTFLPAYAPEDAACCPSQYEDITYAWDPASNALVAGSPTVVPATEFEGWDATRARLESEGFFEVFRGL